MFTRLLMTAIFAVAALPTTTASAGEWLGGQYWGQISGCGHCGGSLYGGGRLYGLGYCCEESCQTCNDCFLPAAPLAPMGWEPTEAIPPGVDAPAESVLPDAEVPLPPVRRTSVLLRLTAAQRAYAEEASAGTADSILPIAPVRNSATVKTITHRSQPERLTPPAARIVAPNAWSGRLYR